MNPRSRCPPARAARGICSTLCCSSCPYPRCLRRIRPTGCVGVVIARRRAEGLRFGRGGGGLGSWIALWFGCRSWRGRWLLLCLVGERWSVGRWETCFICTSIEVLDVLIDLCTLGCFFVTSAPSSWAPFVSHEGLGTIDLAPHLCRLVRFCSFNPIRILAETHAAPSLTTPHAQAAAKVRSDNTLPTSTPALTLPGQVTARGALKSTFHLLHTREEAFPATNSFHRRPQGKHSFNTPAKSDIAFNNTTQDLVTLPSLHATPISATTAVCARQPAPSLWPDCSRRQTTPISHPPKHRKHGDEY